MDRNQLIIEKTDKWQQMQAIVTQHPPLSPDSTWRIRKIQILRLLIENFAACIFQYVGLLLTTLTSQPAVLWFATGASSALILMRGQTIIPGIWLGTLIAYQLVSGHAVLSLSAATIFAAQAYLFALLNYRFIGPTLIFYRIPPFLSFIVLAATLTAATTALLLYVCIGYMDHPVATLSIWFDWWIANLNGILTLTLAIISWDFYFAEIHRLHDLSKPLLAVCYGLLFIVTLALIAARSPMYVLILAEAAILLSICIGVLFGWCGAMAASLMIGLLLTFGSMLSAPIFSSAFSTVTFFILQLTLTVLAITGPVAAMLTKTRE